MADELEKKLGPRLLKVILYGSRARGDADSESDYDCVAVVDAIAPVVKEAIDEIAGTLLLEQGVVFAIIPVSQEHYSVQKYNPLLITIAREGRIIWQRTA